jgi:hypothetical protein
MQGIKWEHPLWDMNPSRRFVLHFHGALCIHPKQAPSLKQLVDADTEVPTARAGLPPLPLGATVSATDSQSPTMAWVPMCPCYVAKVAVVACSTADCYTCRATEDLGQAQWKGIMS